MPSVKSFPQQVLDYLATGLGLSVSGAELSSSNPLPVQNPNAAPTDRSGSITTGGAAQVAMAALATRKAYFFQNVSSEIMWGSFTGTAAPNGWLIPYSAKWYYSFNPSL